MNMNAGRVLKCWIIVIMLWCFLGETHQDVNIDIKLIEFYNPRGTTENGEVCDNVLAVLEDVACDHVFYICVTYVDRSEMIFEDEACPLLYEHTAVFKDNNNPKFSSILGSSASNPVQVSMAQWIGSILLRIKVTDNDLASGDDLVDYFAFNITGEPSDFHHKQWSDNQRIYGLRKLTFFSQTNSFILQYRIYCDEGYTAIENECLPVTALSTSSTDKNNSPSQTTMSPTTVKSTSTGHPVQPHKGSSQTAGKSTSSTPAIITSTSPPPLQPACTSASCAQGTCAVLQGVHVCSCDVGYQGDRCSEKIPTPTASTESNAVTLPLEQPHSNTSYKTITVSTVLTTIAVLLVLFIAIVVFTKKRKLKLCERFCQRDNETSFYEWLLTYISRPVHENVEFENEDSDDDMLDIGDEAPDNDQLLVAFSENSTDQSQPTNQNDDRTAEGCVTLPHAQNTGQRTLPHAQNTGQRTLPHAQDTGQRTLPHAQDTSPRTFPHAQDTGQRTLPHAQDTGPRTLPHAQNTSAPFDASNDSVRPPEFSTISFEMLSKQGTLDAPAGRAIQQQQQPDGTGKHFIPGAADILENNDVHQKEIHQAGVVMQPYGENVSFENYGTLMYNSQIDIGQQKENQRKQGHEMNALVATPTEGVGSSTFSASREHSGTFVQQEGTITFENSGVYTQESSQLNTNSSFKNRPVCDTEQANMFDMQRDSVKHLNTESDCATNAAFEFQEEGEEEVFGSHAEVMSQIYGTL